MIEPTEVKVMPYRSKEKQKQFQQEWFIKNKNKVYDLRGTRRNKAKRWVSEYKKTVVCELCGEGESVCLDFHHKDITKKRDTISSLANQAFSIDAIKEEIKLCMVLCANCHRKIHKLDIYKIRE